MRELLPVIGSSVFFDLLKSILLLLILLIARTVLVRWIKGNHTLTIDAKRRWIVTARNSMVLGLFVGLVVIWAHELEAFAVSLVALAATVVLATKELILCWSGAALRVGGGVYGVGDRIQLGTYRGVVSWNTTSLRRSCWKSGRVRHRISTPVAPWSFPTVFCLEIP
jgi:hypothetical protein